MIVTVVMIVSPAIILGASEDGIFKFTANISSPSTMVSLITVMFTVVLLVPALITAVCAVELKSTLSPGVITKA